MANISKAAIDSDLRARVFDDLMNGNGDLNYAKINDRQYGVILRDLNDNERYIRIGAIVAEEREDITAQELMDSEIATYEKKQADKAAKAKAKAKTEEGEE